MKISIITPTFNAEKTLAESLMSTGNSRDFELEHLLIDAVSRDGTLQVASGFPEVMILSEPDQGIYDGMNKGARLATGEWLLFLQADDWLPTGTLGAYVDAIAANPDVSMICGCAEAVRRGNDDWKTVWKVTSSDARRLTLRNIALGEPMINARLMKRDVFLKLGGFSLKYPLASDRDFLLRCARASLRQVEIDILTYRYRWHEGSSTMTDGNSMTAQLIAENLSIVQSHLLDGLCKNQDDINALRSWHTRLTVQSAMNALESLNPEFLRMVLEGHRWDALWSVAFTSEFLGSLPAFLARGCRTRSQLLKSSR